MNTKGPRQRPLSLFQANVDCKEHLQPPPHDHESAANEHGSLFLVGCDVQPMPSGKTSYHAVRGITRRLPRFCSAAIVRQSPFFLPLEVLRSRPLPVGETGFSKCKAGVPRGITRICTSAARKIGETTRQAKRALHARGAAPLSLREGSLPKAGPMARCVSVEPGRDAGAPRVTQKVADADRWPS